MPTERRKNPRLGLAIPLRVQGFLADASTWDEMTNTIDVFISNLRRKLEEGGEPRLLHTKRGAGYVMRAARED